MSALELDGSAGGGQLLRTALTLACLDERPFELSGIRSDRQTPGLKAQHCACVDVAAALTDATVDGNDVGSDRLSFEPTRPPAGDVTVDIGTAGSVALVFETVLPLAVGVDDPVSVTATGGTDVKWAPTLDYLQRVKLPLLARYGLAADVTLERRGFYPAGGGCATLRIAPSSLRPVVLDARGDLVAGVYAVAATDLGDDVCDRALDRVRDDLPVPVAEVTAGRADTACPGFALCVSLGGQTRAGFTALGERGVPAEAVADSVVDAVDDWCDGPGVVDANLADQLVVPLALGGGQVRAPRTTTHLRTNRSLVEAFGYEVTMREDDDGVLLAAPC